jgi:5-formyltetrahydrofolate cyclo-ligase
MNSLKIEQRNTIKGRKLAANKFMMEESSSKIFAEVEKLPEFIKSKNVLAYWSLPDEVYTHDFVKKWHKEKIVSLPIVVGSNLEIRVFTGMECMKEGSSFGILEPSKTRLINPDEIDIVLVPGVAFDIEGNRLGRGKGYYDSLLSNTRVYKIGVCFEFQILEKVATSSHDIKMDKIIYA